ncbi:hypothetical protein Ptr902_00706 [Pyrenophora tritici-repentis]|nr:hypothetical protein Ptr902_00706 [Pyrenophora tritici-repentis]
MCSTFSGRGELILWGSVDPALVDEEALNDWWTNEHLPERLRLPGFQLARRYRGFEPKHGQHEYLALYEVSSVQDLASTEYMHALNHPTDRTVQFMPCLAKMNRFACGNMYEHQTPYSVAGTRHMCDEYLLMVVCKLGEEATRFGPNPLDIQRVFKHISHNEHAPSADIRRVRVSSVSPYITAQGSASKSYDGVGFNTRPDNAPQPLDRPNTLILLFDLYSTTTPTSLSTSTWFTKLESKLEESNLRISYKNMYSLIATLVKDAIEAEA